MMNKMVANERILTYFYRTKLRNEKIELFYKAIIVTSQALLYVFNLCYKCMHPFPYQSPTELVLKMIDCFLIAHNLESAFLKYPDIYTVVNRKPLYAPPNALC